MSLSFLMSEQVLVITGLLLVHVVYGSYSVFIGSILDDGITSVFVVIAGSLSAVFILAPLAVAFERNKWPEEIRLGLVVKFLLASFGEVTLYQPLLLLGLEKTSPAISTAMTNLSPGVIFLIAACLRLEKFNIKCKYTILKIVGTFMCIIGVLMVTLLQTSPTPPASSLVNSNLDWIIGCIALSIAVFINSCGQILMTVIMKEFHAPISSCGIILFIGAILTAMIQLFVQGKLDVGSSTSIPMFIVYCLIIGVVNGGCFSFQVWSIKIKGPVFVSMFTPTRAIVAAILSAIILRKVISLGSLAGIAIMFVGLYLFLWSKNKETSSIRAVDGGCRRKVVVEIEKPLLE